MSETKRSRNRRIEQRDVRRLKARWPLVVKYGEHGLSVEERMTDAEYAAAVARDNGDRFVWQADDIEVVKGADLTVRHPEGLRDE